MNTCVVIGFRHSHIGVDFTPKMIYLHTYIVYDLNSPLFTGMRWKICPFWSLKMP